MSYYDDEVHYKSSARLYGFLFKVAFNFAIIMILYKLLYIPNYPEELKNSAALYVMPIIGIVGAFFYLSYWIGRKSSMYIVGIGGFSIGLLALTSFETILTLYSLVILAAIGYVVFLLIKLYILPIFKKRR
ncbi:hypothetical protein [Sphingobacterium sp. NPDC055346]